MAETKKKPTSTKAAETPEERMVREKAELIESGDSREVRAVAKYLRFSAQKGRLVVDMVRGKTVAEAATILAFSKRDAAKQIAKALKSAAANAENNHGMDVSRLYVEQAFVDEGPTVKRFKPRARGRGDRIFKRMCHVTIVLNNAPESLLAGRGSKSAAPAPDRSARVAASKEAAPAADKKPAAKKAPAAKKDAAAKADVVETEAVEEVVEETTPEAATTAAESEAPEADAADEKETTE